ncbi:non-ribosomal peptide synthetase [Confluentibacter sediminis]|uniref:non-ribosomal peptide synthetase n=1 Tax=Confluentibacter sediminis TaxID=2219045 RepID=UPI000DAE63DD|nr:non-ribosomal peptide synthetase [Confluentibacter sediminis]
MNNQSQLENKTQFNPFSGPELERVIKTTESQLDIWSDCIWGGDDANRAYDLCVYITLKGNLVLNALQNAVKTLVQRHESLRASFSSDGGLMSVYKSLDIEISYNDISNLGGTEKEQSKNNLIKEEATFIFDLINGPLFRVKIIKCDDLEHILVLTQHHIIADGLSTDIIMEELSILYSAYVENKSPVLPDAIPFHVFAKKVNSFAESDDYKDLEKFWLNMYEKSPPIVDLPIDYVRPPLRTYNCDRIVLPLDNTIIESLKKLGIKSGCSLVTTMLSAFEVFLYQLTGKNDLIVGFPFSASALYHMRQMIGNAANLLPLRSNINSQNNFHDYLKQRNNDLFDAYENQQVSFGHILQKLNIARDPSRVPLVPVILTVDLNNDVETSFSFSGLSHKFNIGPRFYGTFELQLYAFRAKNGPSFLWNYNTKLFKPDTIKQMMTSFEDLLNKLILNPDKPLSEIINSDKKDIYYTLNNTEATYPKKALHELLIEQANSTPNDVALEFNKTKTTYADLQNKANQLAYYFQAQGLGPGDFAAVAMHRSPELLITLLAILQCGAAYIPLDPAYPKSRLEFMLSDSKSKFLITTNELSNLLPSESIKLIIEDALDVLTDYPLTPLKLDIKPESLAYILYTSGSTGKPKGVPISHKNLVNFLFSMKLKPGISNNDRFLSITTISFDIAGLELFLPILSGATLILADNDTARDGRLLLDLLQSEAITMLQATPTTWKMLLDSGWEHPLPIKALCGGEALPFNLANNLLSKCDSLWNMYGPTETTIWSAIKQIHKNDELITIGKPIANTQIYILDENNQLLPPEAIGEICISGDGVSQGYWNRLELTNEKFIVNPFSTNENAILYRTGDLGKLLPNGEFQCLGRTDQQIKIRGHRIELGDIEHAISLLEDIQDVVVVANSDRLIAYIVSNKGNNIPNDITKQWRDSLKTQLPEHLIPQEYNILEALPKTLNGKIDRKALLLLQSETPKNIISEYTAPRNKAEEIVADIWQEALQVEKVDIFSNFFELGGHSLIAVKVMNKLETETGKRLPLSSLFEYSTVEKLAQLLEKDNESVTWDSLVPIKPKGTKTPLYIIHGAGLNVLKFIDLSKHLDDDQPVFGIQGTGVNSDNEPYNSIEEIAQHYISSIIKKNPNGPYALAGYSFGGIIAFEMAKQLINQGKKVSVLAMLDSYVYPYYYYKSPLRKKIESSVYQINWRLYDLKLIFKSKSYLKSRINGKKERLFQFYYNKFKKNKHINPEYIQDNFKVTEMVRDKYHLTPLPIEIDLFRAKSQSHYMHDTMYLGWKPITLKGISIHEVPGNHAEIFSPPFDKEAALILQNVLDERSSKFEN